MYTYLVLLVTRSNQWDRMIRNYKDAKDGYLNAHKALKALEGAK